MEKLTTLYFGRVDGLTDAERSNSGIWPTCSNRHQAANAAKEKILRGPWDPAGRQSGHCPLPHGAAGSGGGLQLGPESCGCAGRPVHV